MHRSKYLIATIEQPRVRRAADVTRIVIGVLVFLFAARQYNGIDDPNAAMAEWLTTVPGWVDGTLNVIYGVGLIYTIGLVIVIGLQWRTRWDALRDMILAALTTGFLVVFFVRIIDGEWPRVIPELGLADPAPQYPIFRVATVVAILLVVSPHLTRPLRRLGAAVILLVAFAGFGIGLGLPSSALGSIALGAVAAGLVLLGFGSPRGYPNMEGISDALSGLGLTVTDLRLDDDQSWGVRRLIGDNELHGTVEVKAYGRDATDSQVFARTWQYLWYRDTEPSLMLTRMQSVEHEALVTIMAERTSADVPHVLTAGLGGDDVAILAVDRSGRRLSEFDSDSIDDSDLIAVWSSIAALHGAAISHGALRLEAVSVSDGLQIGDFAAGTLAASESFQAVDVVEFLFSMSAHLGVARSVSTAAAGLGHDRLHKALPYMQLPAISSKARRKVDKPKELIQSIRDEVSATLDVEAEEAVEIRRVTPRNLFMTGLSLFAAYFLISQMSGIDFEAVWAVMQSADWVWIAVAFIVGQFVYFPEATGMLAAVGQPIPLRPAIILQSAIKFIGLAVPSSAGRIGMQAAFLRKYGVGFTASLVQGSIDTISGLVVEILILLSAVVFIGVNVDLDSSETEWGPIILVVLIAVVAVVLLVTRVQKVRDWIMPVVTEAFGALGSVLKDPKRTLGLVASNFGSRFILAVSMWMILLSLDVELGIWTVLVATVATGLLGGLVPIPGGIGVSEAVLTAFLVFFGVEETTAFAAAVVYRIATFYIPAGYGWLSMRWLEKNGYI
jgi:uncharacterized protein (TIRG00374 family)